MANKDFNRGDLVVVVDDTNKANIGKLAKYIGYNNNKFYHHKYPYMVNIIDAGTTAVLEIRHLSLLEIELNS